MADTTVISYLPTTAITDGSAALNHAAAMRKLVKYEDLSQRYAFVPIAIESDRTFSKPALDLLHELGLRATTVTSEHSETSYLIQHLFIVIQRFVAVCFANNHQLTANFFKVFLSNAHPVTNAFISVQ